MHSEKTSRRIRTRRIILASAGVLLLLLAYREPFFSTKRPIRDKSSKAAEETLPISPENGGPSPGSPDPAGIREAVSAGYGAGNRRSHLVSSARQLLKAPWMQSSHIQSPHRSAFQPSRKSLTITCTLPAAQRLSARRPKARRFPHPIRIFQPGLKLLWS